MPPSNSPGSYGDRGADILSAVLPILFPSSALTLDLRQRFALASHESFLSLIIGPEIARRLVEDDTHQPYFFAAQIVQDSAAYGMTMFPSIVSDPLISSPQFESQVLSLAGRRSLLPEVKKEDEVLDVESPSDDMEEYDELDPSSPVKNPTPPIPTPKREWSPPRYIASPRKGPKVIIDLTVDSDSEGQ